MFNGVSIFINIQFTEIDISVLKNIKIVKYYLQLLDEKFR